MREATFKVRVPADLLAFGFSEEQVQSQIREWLVLSLFTEERISSGKAAQFLNLTRVESLKLLQKRGISYLNYNSEELAEEFKSVETMELDRFQ